jgi:hypothetical protein
MSKRDKAKPLHLGLNGNSDKELPKIEAEPFEEWVNQKLAEIETQIQRLQEQSRQDGLK